MEICRYCDRTFQSSQALKAHFGHCAPYKSMRGQSLPALGSQPQASLPKADRHGASISPSNVQGIANIQDPSASLLHQLNDFVRPQQKCDFDPGFLKRQRTQLVQRVRAQVVDGYWTLQGSITPEMRTEAKVAVTDELNRLALDQLPYEDLVLRAEAVRDRTLASLFKAQQEAAARQRETEQQREADRRKQAEDQARRTRRKGYLLELGMARAKKAGVQHRISGPLLTLMELEVQCRLEATLTGEETQPQANEVIEVILEPSLTEYEARMKAHRAATRRRILEKAVDASVPLVNEALPWITEKLFHWYARKFGVEVPRNPQPTPEPPRNESAQHASPQSKRRVVKPSRAPDPSPSTPRAGPENHAESQSQGQARPSSEEKTDP